MDKHQFAKTVRSLLSVEPSRNEWVLMYEMHCEYQFLEIEEIVKRNGFQIAIQDNRRITATHTGNVLSLDDIADWAKNQALKFGKIPVTNFKRKKYVSN